MDPFSTIVGTLQITGQCGRILASLAKYIVEVVTVDQRIQSFTDDVTKLQTTYETLQQCRNSPQMIAAAKAADIFTEHLWSHLATTLRDCENTLVAINHILNSINRPLGAGARIRQLVDRPLKQLRESLHGGELGRHHEKIKMFNTSLALPMQMINITLQLSQRELTEENQRSLDNRLTNLQLTINFLNENIATLKRPLPHPVRRTSGDSGLTLVNSQDNERAICDHMETFAKRVKQFLSNASSAATSRSGASTVQPDIVLPFRGSSEAGMPLTQRQRDQIGAWVPPIIHEDLAASSYQTEATPTPEPEYNDNSDDEEHWELNAVRTFFEHGQEDLTNDDFAAAEENFIEALEVLSHHEFGERLAFQSADVILLLTHCYVEQEKLDEAIDMLLPLTRNDDDNDNDSTKGKGLVTARSRRHPDHGRTLAAHHSLGKVYLKKKDYENAANHGLSAFHGRRKLFGKDNEKTIESVQLLVDIYTAKGERAKARLYSAHRTSETRRPSSITTTLAGPGHRLVERPRPIMNSPPQQPHAISTDTEGIVNSPPASSVFEKAETQSSVAAESLHRTSSITPRTYLKPRFDSVKSIATTSKDKAITTAQHILRGYEPEPYRVFMIRWDDMKKNIKRSGAEKGLAATGQGYAPIHFFCELKVECYTEVELLIEDGVDLMAVCHKAAHRTEPMTPLQIAIEKNHLMLAVLILDALVSTGTPMTQIMSLRDRHDLSPLLVACRYGQIETVTRFLSLGAEVLTGFPRHWVGNSLLHDAASRCHVDMVNQLLSLSSAPRQDIGTLAQQDQFGRTPLMYAVITRNIADQAQRDKKTKWRLHCVEALLQHAVPRVDQLLDIRDKDGRDVWYYAQEEADQRLLELLGRYSGRETERTFTIEL